jgi:AcrR family transcriptional regulator
MKSSEPIDRNKLIQGCLSAFIKAGTLDLSLDQLSATVGVSKRMLVHYFGGREAIEERAMTLLEDQLRAQFSPANLPAGAALQNVVSALWQRTTAAESRGVLLLVMDLTRRAWNGSAPAKAFYAEQQRLWVHLLLNFSPDAGLIEQVLQAFQGAVLAYLVTGDSEPGRRVLHRLTTS